MLLVGRHISLSKYILANAAYSLAKNPATTPFFNAYTGGIRDEDNSDFLYLQKHTEPENVSRREDGDEEEEDESQNYISREEIVHEARKMAQNKNVCVHFIYLKTVTQVNL